jgi:malonyl CoA-acyl carrier protein transacylase
MTTYFFPGQGSQTKGMGKDLFQQFPDLTREASDILGYSIEDLCLNDPTSQLHQTAYTQPALYVVSALSFLKEQATMAQKPDYVAGHSLGEYNALFAAGVFDFATGLKLVQKRGSLMQQSVGGSMAAIAGLKTEDVAKLLTDPSVSIANYNSYTQAVITGPKEAVLAMQTMFEKVGATYIPLKVSGAFHSPLMGEAKQQFAEFIQQFNFALPRVAVIANINALPYQMQALQTNLIDQVTHSVQWVQSMKYLLDQGESEFKEVGPGTVLTGLMKRIQNKL